MRVLLVEDDFIVRQGIVYSIDWESHGLQICGEAMNGEQGYEMVERLKPDIVITDIRMPIMDGLKLAEKIKETYPDMEIIILSGYDDFAYAKKAIHIGVHEYLLKPIDADEFLGCVCKLKEEIEKKRTVSQIYEERNKFIQENKIDIRENLLNKIIKPSIVNNEDQIKNHLMTMGIVFDKPVYQVLLLTIEDFLFLTKGYSEEEKNNILEEIRKIIDNTLGKRIHIESFLISHGQFVIIMNSEGVSKLYIEDGCQKIILKILEKGFQSVFSGGTEKNSLLEVYLSYQEAVSALHQHICQKGHNVIYFDKDMKEKEGVFLEIEEQENQLFEYMQKYDATGMIRGLELIFQKAISEKRDYKSIQATCMKLVVLLVSQLEEMVILKEDVIFLSVEIEQKIQQTHSLVHLEKNMKEFIYSISEILKSTKNDKYNAIVSEAMRYVEEHYAEEISVKNVASGFFVTPNYFSQVFKAQTGVNFTDFLNEYRIKQSKHFLKNNSLKIYEIAELAGYQNYKYFNKVFKKYTGMSPKEYQSTWKKR